LGRGDWDAGTGPLSHHLWDAGTGPLSHHLWKTPPCSPVLPVIYNAHRDRQAAPARGQMPGLAFSENETSGRLIIEVVVLEFGPKEVLRRVADPYWFQALGCALGFDWHSSGLTTTTCAAVKDGIKNREGELGFLLPGERGGPLCNTPREIEERPAGLPWAACCGAAGYQQAGGQGGQYRAAGRF
jgi:hypothetical protein